MLNKNIYTLRKQKGFSQENLAERINVSRQTISNWELGETSPNPDQLLSLSKTLEVSVDELLGNELKFNNNSDNNKFNYIYLGPVLVGGSIAGIWAFAANRFRYIEMLFIMIGGIIIGYGIGLIINGVLERIEWNNTQKKLEHPKSLKKKL